MENRIARVRLALLAGALALGLVGGCFVKGSGPCPPGGASASYVATRPSAPTDGPGAARPIEQPASASSPAWSGGDTPARDPGCAGSEVVVFDDDGFGGRAVTVPRGRHDVPELEALGSENDTIRSVCVPSGCVVTLYEHGGFEGTTVVVRGDRTDLGEFAGSASGVEVSCM